MDARSLWNTYDFTESVVLDMRWANDITSLLIELDYYWDLSSDKRVPGGTQRMLLEFLGCIWTVLETSRQAVQKDIKRSPEAFTIIGWRIDPHLLDAPVHEETPLFENAPHLGEALGAGYHYVYLQSAHSPERPWLQVVCRDVTVTRI